MTKRAELILILSCAVLFFASFLVYPLFPVQRYPLFADAPTQYETYQILNSEGIRIPLSLLNLQNTYDGDPTFLVGRLPATAYKWGHVLTAPELEKHLNSLDEELLADISYLCIQRSVFGTLSDDSFGVTALDHFVWKDRKISSDPTLFASSCATEVNQ
ncbi:MAG: hypothetical protein J7501_07065 [Bdellovibrio sp.]|nr:hypothetical protein [Bdellovibrio sp.]